MANDDKNMLSVGTLLNGGRYKIVAHLSSGGFGKTYVVEEVFNKGKRYAIKEFFIKGINERNGSKVIVSNEENMATFESQKRKFLREAEHLRDVKNEHIVQVYDFFSDNETCYYVMDLIEGESLNEYNRPLKEQMVWNILDQVLDALTTIHQKQMTEDGKERIWVHLDIKPSNLMIDKAGKITLIDFGASKQLSPDNSISSISVSQMPYTKGYAPIEQTSQRIDSIGPWTDFYALGATLYSLLTNTGTQIPEYSELNELLYEDGDIAKAFTFSKAVSDEMRQLIFWMMNPNRKKRPHSVRDIRIAIKKDGGEKEQQDINEETIIGMSNKDVDIPRKANNSYPVTWKDFVFLPLILIISTYSIINLLVWNYDDFSNLINHVMFFPVLCCSEVLIVCFSIACMSNKRIGSIGLLFSAVFCLVYAGLGNKAFGKHSDSLIEIPECYGIFYNWAWELVVVCFQTIVISLYELSLYYKGRIPINCITIRNFVYVTGYKSSLLLFLNVAIIISCLFLFTGLYCVGISYCHEVDIMLSLMPVGIVIGSVAVLKKRKWGLFFSEYSFSFGCLFLYFLTKGRYSKFIDICVGFFIVLCVCGLYHSLMLYNTKNWPILKNFMDDKFSKTCIYLYSLILLFVVLSSCICILCRYHLLL